MAIDSIRQMTVADYFAFDEASEYKNEYIDGEVIPMTGGTLAHATIMMNAGIALGLRLKGSNCRVLSSAMRISVSPTRYFYPDLSVTCGDPDTDAQSLNLFNPVLVAEVTSPSSLDYDRSAKRLFYQSMASLQVYLLIDQQEPLVELFERQDDGWHMQELTDLDASVPLPALGCELPLVEIYDGIQFDADFTAE